MSNRDICQSIISSYEEYLDFKEIGQNNQDWLMLDNFDLSEKDSCALQEVCLFQKTSLYAQVKALKTLEEEAKRRLGTLLLEAVRWAGFRHYSLHKNSISQVQMLKEDLPNFSEPIIAIAKQLAYLLKTGKNGIASGRLRPVLLLGAPGVGKSYFAERLAESLSVPIYRHAMDNAQGSASLAGLENFWANTQAGLVAHALAHEKIANLVFLLDEIDKSPKHSQYNPLACLHTLLEPQTAQQFCDASLPHLPWNASHITWIATANDVIELPRALLSRFQIFEIKEPTAAEKQRLAERLLKKAIQEAKAELSYDAVFIRILAEYSPREIKFMLPEIIGSAFLHQRDQIEPSDIPERNKNIRRLGFI
jgi:ATP-dependent Lon protease